MDNKVVWIVIALIFLSSCVQVGKKGMVMLSSETPTSPDMTLKTSYIAVGMKTIAKASSEEIIFNIDDHLGSHVLTMDTAGNVVTSFSNLPFGETIQAVNEKYLYTGKEMDETGLYYYGARFYVQTNGRFLTADPKLRVENNYDYVNNNPLKFIDPAGLDVKEALGRLGNRATLPIRMAAYYFGSKMQGAGSYVTFEDVLKGKDVYTGTLYNQPISSIPNILGIYLGLVENTLSPSEYRPTSLSKYRDVPLYSIDKFFYPMASFRSQRENKECQCEEYIWQSKLLSQILSMKGGEIINSHISDDSSSGLYPKIDLGSFTVSIGKDEKGPYISYFDIWDFDLGGDYVKKYKVPQIYQLEVLGMKVAGKPIGFYGRFYLNEGDIEKELNRRSEE